MDSFTVLVVDDEMQILKSIKRQLEDNSHFTVLLETDPIKAKEIISNSHIDIAIIDQKMPKVSGLELISFYKKVSPSTITILMTGELNFDIMLSAINDEHIFYFLPKPWTQMELESALEKAIIYILEQQKKEQIINNYLIDKQKWIEASELFQNKAVKNEVCLIAAFKKIIEVKDRELYEHSKRVSQLAVEFGTFLGLSTKQKNTMENAGIFHDLGKIVIKDRILYKESMLDDNEFQEMKRHPIVGAEVINEIEEFHDISIAIEQHHERADGAGYPKGLVGSDICIEARILSILDAYDALTSDRVYRKGLNKEEALSIIKSGGAGMLDQELLTSFFLFAEKK